MGGMYQPHPILRTPGDETKLWRYMDLSEFLWFISESRLYFANLEELPDKWEGAWPATFVKELERSREFLMHIEHGVNEPYAFQLVKGSREDRQAGFAVNCWHKNDVESVAMWSLYTSGADGVAIQTTVGSLKSCLAEEPRNLFIAEVEYRDHEGIHPVESSDPLVPLTTKRRSFQHESEVRVILDRGLAVDHHIASWISGTLFKGEALVVRAATLVERIVVSPTYPAWAIDALRSQIKQRRILVEVETSDLLRLPNPDLMYRELRMSAADEAE
jgi:hypothetical protein